MRIKYDPTVDVLMIYLREGTYAISEEVAPGMIVDLDDEHRPLRIEILDASHTLELDSGVQLEVLPMVLSQAAV
ncbi:MAG: DUF2283 domain-containing protein [Anaerolineae bacterium]|nr:DUF2283 domain-containing protein [Anaerolineae bacterium]